MSKTKHSPPDELYREYQASRDNIPQASLAAIRAAAQSESSESNIQSILEQAKPLHAQPSTNRPNNREFKSKESKSLVERISSWVFGNGWSIGGVGVAAALVALVGLPMLQQGGLSNSSYTQFEDCAECGAYIANASALTRSTGLTLQRTDPKQRLAAKKGRLSAKFEIAKAAKLNTITEQAFLELTKLAESDETLKNAAETRDVNQAISALAAASSEYLDVYTASKALFIANVTARNVANVSQSELKQSVTAAFTAYGSIEQANELQRNIREQLSKLADLTVYSSKQAENVIEITRRAMESLG